MRYLPIPVPHSDERQSSLAPSRFLFSASVLPDPERSEVSWHCVVVAFSSALLIEAIAAGVAIADMDRVLVVILAALGALVAAMGQLGMFAYRDHLIVPRQIVLMPIVTFILCLGIASAAVVTGHSERFGDGPLRQRIRPSRVYKPIVVHDGSLPVKLGASEVKILSTELLEADRYHRKRLKIVVQVTNVSPTTKINNLRLVSAGLSLRDNLGNRYAKDGEESLKFGASDRVRELNSLYPDERAHLEMYFEPPIKRAAELTLAMHFTPLTSTKGVQMRIPKSAWEPALKYGNWQ